MAITAMQALQAYANDNQEFVNRFGQVTRQTFDQWVNAVVTIPEVRNSFLSYLINKIGRTYVNSMIAKNPLAFLRGEDLPFGSTIEDMFVEITKGTQFDPTGADNANRKLPDVKVLYYYKNVDLIYKTSVSDKEIKLAFYREGQMSALIQRITAALYESHRHDFFVLVKEMFAKYDGFHYVKVPAFDGTKATAQEYGKILESVIQYASFDNKYANSAGVLNNVPENEGILLLTVAAKTSLDYDFLANVFNLTVAELKSRIVVVDNFGGLQNVDALYIDRRFAQIHYLDESMETFRNSEGRFTNYTLVEEAMFVCAKYFTAIAFTSAETATLTVNGANGEKYERGILASATSISTPFNTFTAPAATPKFKGWGATASATTTTPEVSSMAITVAPSDAKDATSPKVANIYAVWGA